MTIRPISPDSLPTSDVPTIPDVVFGVFNDLIAQGFGGRVTRVKLKDVRQLAADRGVDLTEADRKHWWDVESAYRGAGWEVRYDQPGYNESPFDPYYEFYKP